MDVSLQNIKGRGNVKIFGKTIISLFLVTAILTSCNGFISTPAASPTDVIETAITTVKTAVAETQMAIPTATFTTTPPPSPSALPSTETSIPISDQIVYYYFVAIPENVPPEGSLVIMSNALILAPTLSNIAHSSDTVTDLGIALEAVLNDERNVWISKNLEITDIAFSEGHADVVLQGKYYGVAPIMLTAARMQILLTMFANASVQTATVTLNGDTIANIDISKGGKPADYVYTRSEIETFIAEHAYVLP